MTLEAVAVAPFEASATSTELKSSAMTSAICRKSGSGLVITIDVAPTTVTAEAGGAAPKASRAAMPEAASQRLIPT